MRTKTKKAKQDVNSGDKTIEPKGECGEQISSYE